MSTRAMTPLPTPKESETRIPCALAEAAAAFEADFTSRLDRLQLPPNLLSAVRYAALGGGKRMRPVLILLACQAVGGRVADALGPAAAMELVHTFSLVHDDLPAMDDDALRRGQPTLHVHAGEAMAILAGDVMLSKAFELLLDTPAAQRGEAAILVRELAAATSQMIAGQVYDTLGGFPDGAPPRRRLDLIHSCKTGALIRASVRIGGVCGGASPAQLAALTGFGEAVGLMFQIVDDLLDVTQSTEHLGKAAGKDQSAGKLTFPGLIGVDESRAEVARLRRCAVEALAPLGERAEPLRDLCGVLAERTR